MMTDNSPKDSPDTYNFNKNTERYKAGRRDVLILQ